MKTLFLTLAAIVLAVASTTAQVTDTADPAGVGGLERFDVYTIQAEHPQGRIAFLWHAPTGLVLDVVVVPPAADAQEATAATGDPLAEPMSNGSTYSITATWLEWNSNGIAYSMKVNKYADEGTLEYLNRLKDLRDQINDVFPPDGDGGGP